MSERVRVRYAPSPTGYLHIGNARTALFNYLFAKHYDGDFVVRIEDTDSKRNLEDGESSQFDNLKWLGLDWDESIDKDKGHGPYRQSERADIYNPLIQQLLDEDKAYKCYMTEEELEEEREAQIARGEMPRYGGKHAHLTEEQRQQFEAEGRKPAIRFRVPKDKTYTFDDMVKGEISFDSNNIGDWVIVKKDGVPTYNFAVAVDDHYMEISDVIRGDDHVSNTPKQLMIYEAFGWESPRFAHMSLIVNEQRKKLSKRDVLSGRTVTGGIVTVADSSWQLSFTVNRQQQFKKQPKNQVSVWIYALYSDEKGDFIKKPITECTGSEICQEWLYHMGVPQEEIVELAQSECNTIPVYMPYVTAYFMPRAYKDRPLVVPNGSKNLAFIGNFAETARDTVFTTEYSVRTAMEAVYQLLDVDRGVPEVYASEFDARVLMDAFYELNDRKSLHELVNKNFIKRSVLNTVLKKIRGTFIEELLRKHKLL